MNLSGRKMFYLTIYMFPSFWRTILETRFWKNKSFKKGSNILKPQCRRWGYFSFTFCFTSSVFLDNPYWTHSLHPSTFATYITASNFVHFIHNCLLNQYLCSSYDTCAVLKELLNLCSYSRNQENHIFRTVGCQYICNKM